MEEDTMLIEVMHTLNELLIKVQAQEQEIKKQAEKIEALEQEQRESKESLQEQGEGINILVHILKENQLIG